MSEWISVKERLPAEGSRVLTYDGYAVCASEFDDLRFHEPGCSDHMHAYVSHWMPLPDPPAIAPKPLTKTEALREAIDRLERIINSCREGCHHSNILEAAVDGMEALPRLRAALESED